MIISLKDSPRLSRLTLASILSILGVFCAVRLGGSLTSSDFASYWLGARYLFIEGGNPYNYESLVDFGARYGFSKVGVLYVPPWLLLLALPLAVLPLTVATVVVSALGLWSLILVLEYVAQFYPGRSCNRYVYLIAFTFYPVLVSFVLVQISAFQTLAVIVGLIALSRRDRWLLPICTATWFIKPQCCYLLFFAITLVAILRGGWGYLLRLLGVVVGLVMFCEILATNSVLMWYRSQFSPYEWMSLSIVTPIRLFLFNFTGTLPAWPIFVVPLVCLLFVGILILRSRDSSSLFKYTPLLICASALTAPYGWIYDWVIFVPVLAWIWFSITKSTGTNRVIFGLSGAMLYFAPLASFSLGIPSFYISWVPLLTGLLLFRLGSEFDLEHVMK